MSPGRQQTAGSYRRCEATCTARMNSASNNTVHRAIKKSDHKAGRARGERDSVGRDSGVGSSRSHTRSPSAVSLHGLPASDDELAEWIKDVDFEKVFNKCKSPAAIPEDPLWMLRLIVEYAAACGLDKHTVFDDKFAKDWDSGEVFSVLDVIAKYPGKKGWYVVMWDGVYSHPNWISPVHLRDLCDSQEALSRFDQRTAAVSAILALSGTDRWKAPAAQHHLPLPNDWGWMKAEACFHLSQCVLQMMEEQIINKIELDAHPDAAPVFVVDLSRPPRTLTDRTCRLPFGTKRRTQNNRHEQASSHNKIRVEIINMLTHSPVAEAAIQAECDKGILYERFQCACAHGRARVVYPRGQLVIVADRLRFCNTRGDLVDPDPHLLTEEEGRTVSRLLVECCEDCECDRATCGNRVLYNGRRVAVAVTYEGRRIGWGVRAAENIEKGTYIGEYLGEVRTDEEAVGEDNSYFFQMLRDDGSPSLIIDATNKGDYTRFFNHACDPSMCVVPVVVDRIGSYYCHMAFFARRDIAIGEPLTFKYTQADSAVGRGRRNKCRCASDNCRGFVFGRE